MVDAEAPVAYACPCQVLRPRLTTCLNSNLLRTHPYAATSVGRLDGPLPGNNLGSAPALDAGPVLIVAEGVNNARAQQGQAGRWAQRLPEWTQHL